MAPASTLLFFLSIILMAIAAPVPAPNGIASFDLTLPNQDGTYASFAQATGPKESSVENPSVANRAVKFIPGATVPPINKSIFRRLFPGLYPGFGGFPSGNGGPSLIPGGGGGRGCRGFSCFIEEPNNLPPKNGKSSPPAFPPPKSTALQSEPSTLPPQATQGNVPAQVDSSKGGISTSKENSAKAAGDN